MTRRLKIRIEDADDGDGCDDDDVQEDDVVREDEDEDEDQLGGGGRPPGSAETERRGDRSEEHRPCSEIVTIFYDYLKL